MPGRSARWWGPHRRRDRCCPSCLAADSGIAAEEGALEAEQGLAKPALHGPQVARPEGEQRGRGRNRNVLELEVMKKNNADIDWGRWGGGGIFITIPKKKLNKPHI